MATPARRRAQQMANRTTGTMILLSLVSLLASVTEARLTSSTQNHQQISSGAAQVTGSKLPSEFAGEARGGLVLNEQETLELPYGEGIVLPTEEIYEVHRDGGLQNVHFTQCPGDLPAPLSLLVECSDRVRKTCSLRRGGNYTVVVRFNPTSDSTTAIRSLVSWNTPFPRPLPAQDGAACGLMPCPLTQGTETTFRYTLNIPRNVMRRRYPLVWRLDDMGSRRTLLCFTFGIHLT